MRVIIAGTRDFSDFDFLAEKCNEVFEELSDKGLLSGVIHHDVKMMEIVSGGALGADTLGEIFAEDYGIKLTRFLPDWTRFGSGAGFIRNTKMSKYAQEDDGVLIAFWDGKSKGTAHMIETAVNDGLIVRVFMYESH